MLSNYYVGVAKIVLSHLNRIERKLYIIANFVMKMNLIFDGNPIQETEITQFLY